jgi:hypothetical protein
MRKLVALFLSLYIVFLTVQPCVDHDLKPPGLQCQQIHATTPASESSADHHDACSPFCTCSCCSLSMAVSGPMALPPAIIVPQVLSFCFITGTESIYVQPVWDPPRG